MASTTKKCNLRNTANNKTRRKNCFTTSTWRVQSSWRKTPAPVSPSWLPTESSLTIGRAWTKPRSRRSCSVERPSWSKNRYNIGQKGEINRKYTDLQEKGILEGLENYKSYFFRIRKNSKNWVIICMLNRLNRSD